jgi:hypothetical protein
MKLRGWTRFPLITVVCCCARAQTPGPSTGLALPGNVLQKFYRQNALRWVPGIAGAK